MRSNWKFERLGDLIELKYGFGLPERKRVFGEVPVYGSSGIIGYHNESAVKGPSIIVGRKGNVGAVTFSKNDFWPIDTTYYIEENRDRYDLRFLFFLLKTLNLNSLDTAAAVPGLSRESFYNIEDKLPPLPIQRKIASILSAYDDLIETNERRIKILEEMARLIYKEWFVKFRFPGYKKIKMIKSELGKIPEGWEVKQIKKILNIRSGYAFKSEFFIDAGVNRIVRIGDVKGDFSIDTDSLQAINLNLSEDEQVKFGLKKGDILLTLTGNVGRLGVAPETKFKLFCNQRVAILDFLDKNYHYYIWFLFKSHAFNEQIIKLAGGVAQANLSPVLLEQQLIIIPSEDIVSVFNGHIAPIFEQMLTLVSQNNILRQARDMLLPKLISGEIDVSDLDIKVSQ